MALCVLIRVVESVGVIKSKDSLIEIIATKDFLTKLKQMYVPKPHLAKYIECLLNRIGQCPAYYKFLSSELKFEASFIRF